MSTATLASTLQASETGLATVAHQAAAILDDVGLRCAPALDALQQAGQRARQRIREAAKIIRQEIASVTATAESECLALLAELDVPMLSAPIVPSLEQTLASEAHEDTLAAQAACRGVQSPAESRARVPLSRPLAPEMAPPVEDDEEEQPEPEGEPTPAEPPVDSEGGEMFTPSLADEDDEKSADAILGVGPADFHAMRGVAEAIIDEEASEAPDRQGATTPEFQSALNDTVQQVANDPSAPPKKARAKRKR